MKSVNVGFFTDTYLPNIDGVVTSMLNYRGELEKRGHKVFVFSSGDRKARMENEDKRVFFFRSAKFPLYPQYKIALFPYSSASEIAKEKKLDLVHCHALASMGLAAIKTSSDLKIPLVGTFHTMVPLAAKKMAGKTAERILWRAVKAFYSRFDLVTCPSSAIRQVLSSKGIDSVVVPNAIDERRFNTSLDGSIVKNALGAEKIVMVAGRLSQEKNVEVIIKAASQVLQECGRDFETKFVITGDGPARKGLEKLAKEEGLLGKNIVFTGFLKSEDLPFYYAAADCFATASTFETQGLAVLEAMACGKPVVGANAMAIPEAVREGKNGFLFQPGNDVECAEKICGVLKSPRKKWDMLSESARKTALEYTVEKSTSKLLKAYARVL
ncbi:MAG TPA: glycosyltransferase [Candidatus Norongarragalinales archaeon]|nr:glycosyltransferase [Candidatus Norongarragalinales archaeon]